MPTNLIIQIKWIDFLKDIHTQKEIEIVLKEIEPIN